MIVHCPNCQTRYNLTPKQLGPTGRKVRCIKCSHEWHQPPAEEEPEETPAPEAPAEETPKAARQPEPTPAEQPPLPPENPQIKSTIEKDVSEAKNRMQKRIIISMMTSIIVLAVVFALIFALRGPLMKSVPALQAVYDVFGMRTMEPVETTSSTGLIIGDIERVLAEDDGITVLIFTGTITNTTGVDVPVVAPRVSILDEQGIELDSFPALAHKKYLKPGEQTTWVCRFFDPPLESIAEYRAQFTK